MSVRTSVAGFDLRLFNAHVRAASPIVACCLSLCVGCAGIKHTAEYRSDVRHQPLGVRTDVTVLIAPQLREDRDDEPERLEYVRQTLQSSLRRDLNDNGPITPDVKEGADARLVVVLTDVHHDEKPIWIMTWFLAPLWLFGVPMNRSVVKLALRVELSNAQGRLLYQATERSECIRYEGIYYGHETLTYGCPALDITERVRDQISLERATILGGLGPRVQRAPPPTLAARPSRISSGEVLAVFQIQDLTEQVEPKFMTQLTEYLAAQSGQQLGFKVVPRQTIREQLLDTKADSMRACYDETCQIELGKAVAAAKTLSTNLIRAGDRCIFNATIYDLKTESADRAASAETQCTNSGLLDGVRGVVKQLAQ